MGTNEGAPESLKPMASAASQRAAEIAAEPPRSRHDPKQEAMNAWYVTVRDCIPELLAAARELALAKDVWSVRVPSFDWEGSREIRFWVNAAEGRSSNLQPLPGHAFYYEIATPEMVREAFVEALAQEVALVRKAE